MFQEFQLSRLEDWREQVLNVSNEFVWGSYSISPESNNENSKLIDFPSSELH